MHAQGPKSAILAKSGMGGSHDHVSTAHALSCAELDNDELKIADPHPSKPIRFVLTSSALNPISHAGSDFAI